MSLAARRFYLVLTILGCFGGGSLYGWSGYQPAVRAEFEVSNATASLVFSLALVSFTFGVLLGPILLARVAPRFRLPLIAGVAALSLALSGMSAGLAGFASAYGIAFGFASGALYNFTISMASASGAATLLVPISVAAFGLGGAVFGPIHVWLTQGGWGLWSVLPALGCLAIVASIALVLKPAPTHITASQPIAMALMRPNKTIATLWVIFAAGSCAGLITLGFAAQFLSQASTDARLASLAIFLAALGNTLGRLSSTLTVGYLGPARGTAGALVLSIITLCCLILAAAPALIVGLLFFVAFAYGQLAATIPLLVKSQVSDGAFSSAFGWVFTGWGVAGLLGPWTAGWVLDATGTLRFSLLLCIGLAGLGLGLVLRLDHANRAQQKC